jgi:BolA family transcriptional regulator, general stress-responsive regulator
VNTERVDRIREILTAALSPTTLEITDDSHKHAGHAGARDGRGHFSVEIESEAFVGKSLIARHRMVYAALGEMMHTDIHALVIQAKVPIER